ncbi:MULTISPECIES: threonine synthase [Marinobacter]|uniref:Threonine synthase n=1 Tax=Marinobacter xiaoshiensis TaxID=3073652 RepID=A0ABU2HMB8_9GAMM|nr:MULTISPECIES: threonine synthase [unclassified Marinobacter]MBK1872837.1 threonine synthase [Marinobacter sp. 1-3A]MBK1886912.1 threonine synthase [Marinobacter sp. DY40_1A1]MDS1311810.1 threonine synthase [Marinobacter sp. F60267]
MRYISTRGEAPALGFEDVLLTGLAPDGGLYVPESLPHFSLEEIRSWRGLPYTQLAFNIMYPFVEEAIPEADFRHMLDETYAAFAHKAVAPLVQLDTNEWVMELFRGPTLAFKDFALQLLGRLLDYVLEKRQEHAVIMGATSGDTGSAAIEGCRHCEHVDIFILHPYQRVSEVQRRQMTTVLGDNVHNIAIKGNFDDCQRMVKESFGDQSFLGGKARLAAVNSINWARIMAQIVYYFHASLALGGPDRSMAFSVPTGNFGDIFAGYLAKKMGLPISQLVIATNRNDILHRFMSGNKYEQHQLEHTLSPSMDIMVSSNFERLLFDLHGRDGLAVKELLENASKGPVSIEDYRWKQARKLFDSAAVDDKATCATIREVYEQNEYLLDPHTAIGVRAARTCRRDVEIPMITLGTAHPAKFPDAITESGLTVKPELPAHMADLFEREERYTVLDNDRAGVQDFIAKHWKNA